jgi:soluble lytic murein transglycosylase
LVGVEHEAPAPPLVRRRLLGLRVLCMAVGIGATSSASASVHDPVPTLQKARAVLEEAEGRARAAELLLELRDSEVADHAQLLRTRLLRETGELDGAVAAGQAALQHAPPSEVRARVHRELGATYLDLDDAVAAYRELRRASEVTRDPELAAEAMVELARAFESRGLPGDALLLYRQTWAEWPLTEAGLQAYERSEVIRRSTGAPYASQEAYLERADRLRTAYRCEAALESYELAIEELELDADARERAQEGRAHCLFQRRRYHEAAEAFRTLAQVHPDDVSLEIMAARSLARLGESAKAVQQLEAIAARVEGATRENARYLVAVIERTSQPAKYQKLLRSLERQRVSPTLSQRAAWRLAWTDLREGRYGDAVQRLEPLARGSILDIEVQRALYWLAVAEHQRDEEKGRAGLRRLVDEVPLSYYGLMAAGRLGIEATLERSFVGKRNGPTAQRSSVRAEWLIEGGFPAQASDELESWLRGSRLKREDRVTAASQLHRVGNHFRAVRLVVDGFGGALEQGIDPEWSEVWRLAWPRPYADLVQEAAREFDFDPALVYAVMREESTYRPKVESPVGARGLMQIIPPTADRIAQALGAAPFDAENLFQASTNVRFGTYYLKDLLRRFGGSEPLAIAAYNAGPEIVGRWVKRDEPFAADAFVDSVPYGETRRYLRKVLTSYHIYKLLYESGPAASAQPPEPASR